MSLELSNEDLRTLIDLVADRLHCALRDEHMPKLENLRVRLDSDEVAYPFGVFENGGARLAAREFACAGAR